VGSHQLTFTRLIAH
jgi:Ca2+-binding EF-hand superfamily protein